MKKFVVLFLALLSFGGVSYSADTEVGPSDPVWLTEVRASIKAKKYNEAIVQLQTANNTSSADWNNLMGYSLRKKQPPDLTAAANYYQAALKIDPEHRGALEYYGELMLINKDLPGAQALLVRLDKACTFGCEEYTDLKESIQQYQVKK